MWYADCKINFPCPGCKQTFPVSLYKLFPDEVLICPICGASSLGDGLNEITQAFKARDIELMNIELLNGPGFFDSLDENS